MKFEYKVTYIEVKIEKKDNSELVGPMLTEDKEFIASMNNEGKEGWELISVAPVFTGVTEKGTIPNNISGFLTHARLNFPYACGYSIIRGYYLFWKKS